MSGAKLSRSTQSGFPGLPWWLLLTLAGLGSFLLVLLGLTLFDLPGSAITGPGTSRSDWGLTTWLQRLNTLPAGFETLVRGWTWHESWQQWSINRYMGLNADLAIRYRLPVAVAFLFIGVLLYFGLLWLGRCPMHWRCFDWRVGGGLLLCAWLLLDVPWQWSLWCQLDRTREAFAGQSPATKAQHMYDAELVEFLESLRPFMTEEAARVFLATAPTYEFLAIRAAYRLYPINVFWRRWGPELPPADQLRPGDLVLALAAGDLGFDAARQILVWSGDQQRPARPLVVKPQGALYRITAAQDAAPQPEPMP